MTAQALSTLGDIAEGQWGMITSEQAQQVGVSLHTLSRMAGSGALERALKGVYKLAGSPTTTRDDLRAAYLALGGYRRTPQGQPAVVAGGETAADLHGVGDFYLDVYDFIVPIRRGTRLREVRLRVRHLSPGEFTYVDGMATMTVERLIADLVGMNQDLSLIADVVGDAHREGRIASVSNLEDVLEPLARRNGHASGGALRNDLYELAGVDG